MIKSFGEMLRLNGEVYYAYPTPQNLTQTTAEELQKCGLSRRKAEYIQNISKLNAEGELDLEGLRLREDADGVVSALDGIRGVGVWTAELTIVRGMRKNALPADDLGLRRVISHYYHRGEGISSDEARVIAQKWGSWKGLAAFYLILAERIGIKA